MSTPTQYSSPESTNQYGQPPMPPQMPFTPAPKPKAKRKWLVPVIVAVALIFGFAAGSSSNPAPPAVETIKEVEKKVRVEVPVVPPECKTAFTNAEELFSSAARTSTIFKSAIDAVAIMDVPGINAATGKIKAENVIIDGVGTKYAAAKTKCLAG